MITFLGELAAGISHPAVATKADQAIKHNVAQKQHAAYVQVLRELGAEIEFLKLAGDVSFLFPEDLALLLPELAVVANRPPAFSQQMELVTSVLARHRPVQRFSGTVNFSGGDVVCVGRRLYVATSSDTSTAAIEELADIVRPFGYLVRTVELGGGGSLKAACTFISPDTLVLNPAWVDPAAFENCRAILVDEDEPRAANTLTINGTTLVSASFPRTARRLRKEGVKTRAVDISEFEKIDGRLSRLLLVKESRLSAPKVSDQTIRAVHPTKMPAPLGHASHAIVHGGSVYVSAQLPFDPSVSDAKKMPVEDQTEQVLRNVALVLHSAGSSLADVVHATVHLANPADLERIEATYARLFAGHRPTRSVISNQALPAGVLVEIEVVAAVSKGSRQ